MNEVRRRSTIEQALRHSGLCSDDQLEIGALEAERTGDDLAAVLIRLGFVSESVLRDWRSTLTGTTSVELSTVLPDAAALALIPADVARRFCAFPVACDQTEATLDVALANPQDLQVLDRLRRCVGNGVKIIPSLASERDILKSIDAHYGFELSIDGILAEIIADDNVRPDAGNTDSQGHPLVRLVNALLIDGVKHGASDIHFEPEAGFVRIRYRIDGVLQQVRSLHMQYWAAMVVRLKVLAELDIAETRAPQDGRISFNVAGAPVEFRVSSLPTLHGENVVLRVLDRQKGIVSLDKMGLSAEVESALALMMARPEGLILVTGPTGSGKTTTLYSMLSHISSERINIMTLEDPVEYPLPLLRQTSINSQVKLDFAGGIRAILRQDPDVILVGEIRDEETAEMAFRAAMTGHQVYATLHANTAIGAFARLADLGVQSGTVLNTVIGIVAQRLVRKLCDKCKQSMPPDQAMLEVLGRQQLNGNEALYSAVGCESCDGRGYRGRLPLMEVLRFTPVLEEALFNKDVLPKQLLLAAREQGYRSLADDACRSVLAGDTTLEEVTRVIDFTNIKM